MVLPVASGWVLESTEVCSHLPMPGGWESAGGGDRSRRGSPSCSPLTASVGEGHRGHVFRVQQHSGAVGDRELGIL